MTQDRREGLLVRVVLHRPWVLAALLGGGVQVLLLGGIRAGLDPWWWYGGAVAALTLLGGAAAAVDRRRPRHEAPPPGVPFGTLRLRRRASGRSSRVPVEVEVDGRPAGRFDPGAALDVAVAAGEHRVDARLHQWTSAPLRVEVAANALVVLEVGPAPSARVFGRARGAVDLAVVDPGAP